MAENDQEPKSAPKRADFGSKPEGAPNKKAALAAALRANLARRKARERALRDQPQVETGGDSKTDSEG